MITLHGGVTITIQGARREVSGSWIIAYGTDTFSVAAGYDLMTGERSGGYSCATTPALILAPSLSVPEDFDEVALARKVAKGLPPRSVTALIEVLDIDRSEIIGPVIPRGTLQRLAKTGRPLSREYSERIYSLGRVIDAVGRAYHGDPKQVKGFLYRPHQMLGGDTPLHLARSSSAGADAVLSLLDWADAGVSV